VSQSFGYIPKSGIAGSYGRSMFSFLSSLQNFSRVVVLVYIPTSSVRGFLFPLHPRQNLLFVVLLIMLMFSIPLCTTELCLLTFGWLFLHDHSLEIFCSLLSLSLSDFGIGAMLASYNEFRNVFSSSIFFWGKNLMIFLYIFGRIYQWIHLVQNFLCLGVFDYWFNLLLIGLFLFSIFFMTQFGRLYVSMNLCRYVYLWRILDCMIQFLAIIYACIKIILIATKYSRICYQNLLNHSPIDKNSIIFS
jgi:hypothetical protein